MDSQKKNLNMQHLKVIGFACTVLLNLAWCGLIKNTVLQFVLGFFGSAGITLFIFAAHEGLKHTSNITKYMLRVLILAVVSATPYYFIYNDFWSNKLQFGAYLSSAFTIFYCIGSMVLYDRIQQKNIRIFSVFFFIVVSWFFGVEWAPFAVIIAYILHIYDGNPRYRDFNFIMFFTVVAAISGVFLLTSNADKGDMLKNISLLGTLLGIPLIRQYDGSCGTFGEKSAKFIKYCYYFAYPLLLCLILLIKLTLARNSI